MDIHLQTLVLSIKERAFYADDKEWASMVEAFKALSPEHRILVWRATATNVNFDDKTNREAAKLMHKHLSGLVIESFCLAGS